MSQQPTHPNGEIDSAPIAVEFVAHLRELEAALADSAKLAHDAQEQSARWERLLDAITDPIGVVNADYHLVYANAAYRRLFGRGPDGVSGHECFAAHPPLTRPCETCPTAASFRTRKPAFVQSERVLPGAEQAGADAPDTLRVLQRWTYPVLNPDGSIVEVVEMIKDVTEQERLRAASREAEALRTADRLKSELLGTVGHELRSPLAAIKGYAGTLLRYDGRLPRTERHEFLMAISQASDRLEAIIDELLLMSQLETGLITPHQAPVDLRELAREAITGIERRLPQEPPVRHRFVIEDFTRSMGDGRDDVAPMVSGDRRLLRQALDEVLDNAAKYSPAGGQIDLVLRRLPPVAAQAAEAPERSRTMLELSVRDEGLGIPAEQQPYIFDRFHKVDSQLTSEFGGLGLGLAVCKRVAELHGGSVRVESEAGQGSAFYMTLPEDTGARAHEGERDTERME